MNNNFFLILRNSIFWVVFWNKERYNNLSINVCLYTYPIYINNSPRPLYRLEISSRFKLSHPMFLHANASFSALHHDCEEMTFCDEYALRRTLYQVLRRVLSEGAQWFAPIRDVRARPRDATFVIWISRSSVKSALHMYCYAHTFAASTYNMYVHILGIFARARDVLHAETLVDVLHKLNHYKNRLD